MQVTRPDRSAGSHSVSLTVRGSTVPYQRFIPPPQQRNLDESNIQFNQISLTADIKSKIPSPRCHFSFSVAPSKVVGANVGSKLTLAAQSSLEPLGTQPYPMSTEPARGFNKPPCWSLTEPDDETRSDLTEGLSLRRDEEPSAGLGCSSTPPHSAHAPHGAFGTAPRCTQLWQWTSA